MKVTVVVQNLGLAAVMTKESETIDVRCTPFTIGDDIEKIFGVLGEALGAAIAAVQNQKSKDVLISIQVLQ